MIFIKEVFKENKSILLLNWKELKEKFSWWNLKESYFEKNNVICVYGKIYYNICSIRSWLVVWSYL